MATFQWKVWPSALVSVLCRSAAISMAMSGVAGIGEACNVTDKRNISNPTVYSGTCMDVTSCTLEGWGSAAGYCLGPNANNPDVQCCVKVACSAPDGTPGICKSQDKQCQGGRLVNAPACLRNKRCSHEGTFQCCTYDAGTVLQVDCKAPT
jgi:hypothetical protein